MIMPVGVVDRGAAHDGSLLLCTAVIVRDDGHPFEYET
jgi:hypothetical protein